MASLHIHQRGWHVLRNFNYDDFDYNHVLKQLHVKYGVSPYFKITVEPNPGSPGSSSIRISPSGLGLPDRRYYYTLQDDPIQQAYIQLIRDVAIILCKSTATTADAEIFAKNMFFYEKRIADITPENFELLNPVTIYNPLKVSELTMTDPKLPLQYILTEMFPDANIAGDTEVIVTSPDYMSKVSQIISSTDRNILNSYIMWTLVREYIPYLSSEFTSALETFKFKLMGIEKPLPRWEFCANLVRKHMGLAVDSLLEERNPISDETKKAVYQVFNSVKIVTKKRINKYKVTEDLRRHLNKKISNVQIQIGLPENVRSEKYIKDYYAKFRVLKANLFNSQKNAIVFNKNIEEERLIKTKQEDYIILQNNKDAATVTYLPSINTIYVPKSLLTAPIFESNYPRAIIYGRLGNDITKAVLSSILPYDSAWSTDYKLLTIFHSEVNESLRITQKSRNCLKDFITKKQLSTSEVANLTSLETFKEIISLSVAREALNLNVSDLSHIHQPSLETLEDSALFFLSFSQSYCSKSTKQYEMYSNYVKYQLNQKTLLNILYSQVPEYSSSYDCKNKNSFCGYPF